MPLRCDRDGARAAVERRVREFSWDDQPKRFEWSQGDFVYIPPYCAHQHFNADPTNEARIVVVNSRIVKPMGFDWFEQLERAEGF